jgi:hypothetical protein
MLASGRSAGHAANAEAEDVSAGRNQSRTHAGWPPIPGTGGAARHAPGRSSAIACARTRGDGRETERLRAPVWDRDEDCGPPVPRPAYSQRVAEISLGTRAASRAADSGANRESLILRVESWEPPPGHQKARTGEAPIPPPHGLLVLGGVAIFIFLFLGNARLARVFLHVGELLARGVEGLLLLLHISPVLRVFFLPLR